MKIRKASIKETGEELSQADWARFDAAVAKIKADQRKGRMVEMRGIGTGRHDGPIKMDRPGIFEHRR